LSTKSGGSEPKTALIGDSEKARAMAASPKEYREFAQDCLRGAAETKSERHRQDIVGDGKDLDASGMEVERSLG
jgi:hypothetical protein